MKMIKWLKELLFKRKMYGIIMFNDPVKTVIKCDKEFYDFSKSLHARINKDNK